MEVSVFEKFNDKILIKIIKQIIKTLNFDDVGDSGDSSFYSSVKSVCKWFSIDPSIQDLDFIYNVILLNKDNIDKNEPISKLVRPEIKTFQFDWRVTMDYRTDEYWRQNISLYSKKEVIPSVLNRLRDEGILDIFDGELIDSESRDSVWVDDQIDDIREI